MQIVFYFLYGGFGCDSATCNTSTGRQSDLWSYDGTNWTWSQASLTGVPNRYVGGVAIDSARMVHACPKRSR